MYASGIKQKAIRLRKQGNTYSEIQSKLGIKVPKNTLSYWCKNVKLPASYSNKIDKFNKNHLKRIRRIALDINRKKRNKYLSTLLKKNLNLLKKIDKSTQKLLLSTLYLGEGAKHNSSQTLSLSSSNHLIIQFYLKLLKNCFAIDESKFRVRIQSRFDQDIKSLEDFWRKITNIDKKQFYPTYVDMRTKGKPTLKNNYKGVCTIHYFNTAIQLELETLAGAIIERII